jgi:hypothetical protein
MRRETILKNTAFSFLVTGQLLLASCGKKIEESKGLSSDPDQDPISSMTLTTTASIFKNSTSIDGEITFKNSGKILLPENIHVSIGNAGTYKLKTIVNVDEFDYGFYCLYQGSSGGNKYSFLGCYDSSNRDLGITKENLESFNPYVDTDKKLIVRILGADPTTDTTVLANFEMIDVEAF